MPPLDGIARKKLSELEQKNLRRQTHTVEKLNAVHILREGQKLVSFSENDYLGLSFHPEVIAAGVEALQRYGAGAGASRLVTGNHPLYDVLESTLARIKGTEAACVFGSGYLANIGIIPALVERGDLIIADKLVHACLIDGAKLSDATRLRFIHNDVAHCEELLRKHRGQHRHCLILTDTVFSMDGDRAPVEVLAALAKKYDAWLLTDDAHGLGVVEHHRSPATLQMGTLSKAVGGYGGYLCASRAVVDYIKTSARSFIYSTGLPPAVIASATKALEIIEQDNELTAQPLRKAQWFAQAIGLPGEIQSAIVPLEMGSAEKAIAASAQLAEAGFWVQAIRPPTVPDGTARLRFTFSAAHSDEEVARLADSVKNYGLL